MAEVPVDVARAVARHVVGDRAGAESIDVHPTSDGEDVAGAEAFASAFAGADVDEVAADARIAIGLAFGAGVAGHLEHEGFALVRWGSGDPLDRRHDRGDRRHDRSDGLWDRDRRSGTDRAGPIGSDRGRSRFVADGRDADEHEEEESDEAEKSSRVQHGANLEHRVYLHQRIKDSLAERTTETRHVAGPRGVRGGGDLQFRGTVATKMMNKTIAPQTKAPGLSQPSSE